MHLEIIQPTDRVEVVTIDMIDKLYNLAYEDANSGITSQLDASSNVQGNIEVSAAYEDAVNFLAGYIGATQNPNGRFQNLRITVPNDNYYIRFYNQEFERVCLAAGIGDGVGITRGDARNVASMSNMFKNNVTVDLKDLQYFTYTGCDITTMACHQKNTLTTMGFQTGQSNTNYTTVQTVDIIMPQNGNVAFRERAFGVDNASMKVAINSIDWNGCSVTCNGSSSGSSGYDVYLFYSCAFLNGFNDAMIPHQSDIPSLFAFCILDKVIFREGIVATNESFRGCTTQYIEYPSTITNVGRFFANFRRDSGATNNSGCIVIKAVNPPATSSESVNVSYNRMPAHIYVPDNSVNAYKAASGQWANSSIQALITPMSQMSASELAMGTVTQADMDRV